MGSKTIRLLKGGVCNRTRKCDIGTSCCNPKIDGKKCHFKNKIKNNDKLYKKMKYDYKKLKEFEVGSSEEIYGKKDGKYKSKFYKSPTTKKQRRILDKIYTMRKKWYITYLKRKCYTCDNHCRDHYSRAKKAKTASIE